VRIARPYRPAEAARATIPTPDKEMAIVFAGLAFRLRDDDPAYPAIELANYVLGQSAKSRLLTRLRHAGGMSYGAGSALEVGTQDDASSLSCYAICAPENARKAEDALREELDRWIAAGLDERELADAKQGYVAKFRGALGDDRYVAERLLDGLELGRTLAFQEGVVARIQALEPADVVNTLQARLAGLPRFEILAGDPAKMAAGA
jgi:zinc protease